MGTKIIIGNGADFSDVKVFTQTLIAGMTVNAAVMYIQNTSARTILMESENNGDKWAPQASYTIENQGDYALNKIPYGCTNVKVTVGSSWNVQISVGVSKLGSNGKYTSLGNTGWMQNNEAEIDLTQSQYEGALYYQVNVKIKTGGTLKGLSLSDFVISLT